MLYNDGSGMNQTNRTSKEDMVDGVKEEMKRFGEVSRVRVMLLMSVAYNFFCLLLGLLFCCLSLYR